ncbi:MAG TPA: insulinase family protein [Novosphingobium sp.]|nr:insulinase family protein [Novosphingobium sp.]
MLTLSAFTLAACAPRMERIASAAPPRDKPIWAFQASDVPVDPVFRFGQLANGMRYVIRQNATPKGTALVRMDVAAGSLDESPAERGFAHFVEHMAFNGSTHVPEGEMVRLLERNGLAFGADTNAQTGFEQTLYTLDLPRNDPALLDTALMLLRETASELTITPEAVARERGVVLSEMRDRNSYQLRNLEDQLAFAYPGALYAERLPIGTTQALGGATAETLKAFWRREYVPKQATLVVIGDFDAATVEAAITTRFGSWQPVLAQPQPSAGPVDPRAKGRTDIYLDPALSERITASRNGPWLDEPDSVAQRQENLLRQIGYGIVNRRLQRAARRTVPPYRGAGLGTGDVFEAGRTTSLIVDTVDGQWQRGLVSAAEDYRRALGLGFTATEVAEQVANIRTATQNEAASANTRSNGALVGAALALIRNDLVPATPQSSLARLEAFIPRITPESVLAALKREAVELDDPLLRFQGRDAPSGGAAAIRAAWNRAMRGPLVRDAATTSSGFGYTDFGSAGSIVSDTHEPKLGIREIRFANGVRLNLKHTDLEKDRVTVQLSVDGGELLDTRGNPLATEMAGMLPVGGLGKHSQDELQSLLAGRTVGAGLTATPETFVTSAQTTPRDLELQLQVMTAFLTDPGYRREGEVQYRLNINNFFAQLRATPGSALSNRIGGILSDEDPRFTLQPQGNYRALTFAKLKTDLADRLAHGAIELGIVGDVDEAQAIALVAKTLGALPPREPDFRSYTDNRVRRFTTDRSPRVVRHTGPRDQAIVQLTWPTRDDRDPVEDLTLDLLQRVVQLELTETIREKLGKAYSPGARSSTTFTWPGYGIFSASASVDVHEIPATRAAIVETLAELRDQPVSADVLLRARQPLLEAYDNALKSNRGWLSLVDRAQTEAERIDRFVHARDRLAKLTAADVQAVAKRYLTASGAVEVTVLPEGVEP